MILTSLFINIIQTNGISYITASLINSLQTKNKDQVLTYFHYFVGFSIVYIIMYTFYKTFQNNLLSKLRQWMRQQLIKLVLLVNNENFSTINFTKLNSPINRISSVSFMLFNDLITYVVPNVTFLLIISLYFLYKNRFFGLGFIVGNLILVLYLVYNWKDMLVHNEKYEKFVSDTEAYLQEILNNLDKIIYRGQTKTEFDIFSEKTDKGIAQAGKFYSSTNYHGTIMNIIMFMILFASIGYLIFLFFDKQITTTVFITFFTILLLYRDKMTTVIQQIPDFIEFLGRTESVLTHFKNMEIDFDTFRKRKYEPISLDFRNIRFDNVSFKYDSSDKKVFDKMSIDLDTQNKIIGITGLSGNGKSTFVKLILRLYKCKDGAIYIDGKNIADIDPDYIRKNMTYVNQNSKLFDKKVADNMLYGCNDIDVCQKHLDKIMQYDKIKELYRKFDIYNKQSGSLGENLSGGQRQIVNIIGGLVNPSKILILDEPTNALDIGLKNELLGIIRDFRKHKQCIIIITHDRDMYPLFDETIQID
jgi:ABC-type bacteriocin/lantibiotic exporter with double-glycine peptidase domain